MVQSLQGTGATSCLRELPTDSLQIMPPPQEFVGIGRLMVVVEESLTARWPLPRCSQCGHATRTLLSQSQGADERQGADEPAPAEGGTSSTFGKI